MSVAQNCKLFGFTRSLTALRVPRTSRLARGHPEAARVYRAPFSQPLTRQGRKDLVGLLCAGPRIENGKTSPHGCHVAGQPLEEMGQSWVLPGSQGPIPERQ